jgi:hypothetical protein
MISNPEKIKVIGLCEFDDVLGMEIALFHAKENEENELIWAIEKKFPGSSSSLTSTLSSALNFHSKKKGIPICPRHNSLGGFNSSLNKVEGLEGKPVKMSTEIFNSLEEKETRKEALAYSGLEDLHG